MKSFKLEAPVNFVMVAEPVDGLVTDSGILLTGSPDAVISAQVVHCGDAFDFGKRYPPLYAVGDRLFFPKQMGIQMSYEGVKYRIMTYDNVLAVERKQESPDE